MFNLLRLLLYPFSLVFGVIVRLRSAWYKSRSWKSPIPTIVVGNLSTGGTGKTPHAAMVAEILLQHGKHPATLSRGYGRETKGFWEVTDESKSTEVGDEPLMIKHRFPELPVFVCERRVDGIRKIISRQEAGGGQFIDGKSRVDFIVLDDAYQHLSLEPDLAIVLLTYASLKKMWLLLPAGNGREPLSALDRAQAVIITKCPPEITHEDKESLKRKTAKYTDSPVFFSSYKYLGFINSKGENIRPDVSKEKALLLAGIADPQSLIDWLKPQFFQLDSVLFSDHHHFSANELKDVLSQAGVDHIIVTEKDKVRILDVMPEFIENPKVLTIPVVPDLGKESKKFENFLFERLTKK